MRKILDKFSGTLAVSFVAALIWYWWWPYIEGSTRSQILLFIITLPLLFATFVGLMNVWYTKD